MMTWRVGLSVALVLALVPARSLGNVGNLVPDDAGSPEEEDLEAEGRLASSPYYFDQGE